MNGLDGDLLKYNVIQYVNYENQSSLSPGHPGGGYHPPGVFPCNVFHDSNRKNRLIVSVTRDGRHI